MSCKVTCTRKRFQTYALSTEAGIFISASAFKDDEQPMSAFVTRNENGDIVAQIQNESLSSAHDEWKEKNSIQSQYIEKYIKVFQVIFTILFAGIAMIRVPAIALFVTVFWVVSLFTSCLYNVSYYFAVMLYSKWKMPIIGKYHAAEHMAFHAEIRYKRVPTIDEISKESIYAYRCTTTDGVLIPAIVSFVRTLIISITLCLGLWALTKMINNWQEVWQYNFIFIISAVCITLIGKLLNKLPDLVKKLMEKENILRLFQWVFVSKPGKDEIEVAQQAINLRYIMDEKIKKDQEGYAFSDVSFDVLHKKAIYTFKNGETGTTTLLEYIDSVMSILSAEVTEDEEDSEQEDLVEEPIVKTTQIEIAKS